MPSERPSILITRAMPGASETAARVEHIGARALLSPVLIMEADSDVPLPPEHTVSGLVFTSANGVRAYAARRSKRGLTAWCVGPATARAAHEARFTEVRESAGNAMDLANFIAATSEPESLPLLHVANSAAKGDLRAQLIELGYSVVFAPLYRMRPAPALSDAARDVIAAGSPLIVLIHSAKGAERFAELCAGLPSENLSVVAISEPAAAPLRDLDVRQTHIASAPNEDGLFAALHTAITTLSA